MSDADIAAARSRLLALKARFDAGALGADDYERERQRAERALGDALLAAPATVGQARPSPRLVAALTALVVAVAAGGYALTGSYGRADPSPGTAAAARGNDTPVAAAEAPASGATPADARQAGLAQIAAMVDGLAARMKERPDDAEGWVMLARSYTVLGRFAEALPAYARAEALRPADAGLLADHADAVAAIKGSVGNPESATLIERALAVDPKHPKALALAGTIAYDRGDFRGAIARWQQIAAALPADSELLQQVRASIDDARARLGEAAPTAAAASASAAAPASAPAPATQASVSGTVSLAPALAAAASAQDTVFVFARPEGGRMPLAVLRARVADLPLAFRLDDSMAMAPNARLSGAKSVVVGARVSKSGNAIAQPGDLVAESGPMAPGASGVSLRIEKVVP